MQMHAAVGSGASRLLRATARIGYAARGTVYLLVGSLVLWSCWNQRGVGAPDSTDALAELSRQPMGTAMLWLIALGLVAYAVWRLVQAIDDPDRIGNDAKGLAVRVALAASALIHLSLALSTATIAQGLDSSDGQQGWTAALMADDDGRWLLGLLGVAIVAAGVAHAVKGWQAGFMKYFDADREQLGVLYAVCRFGLVARGVVFVIVGGLLVRTAMRYGPQGEGGQRGAFEAILAQPFGLALLALVGAGLLAFSVYSFVETRHRRVPA